MFVTEQDRKMARREHPEEKARDRMSDSAKKTTESC